MSSSLPGLRKPVQERSRRSLERILNAGAAVLEDEGADGFSISEVCRRANVSSGALYSRFDSKDSLLLAVHAHVIGKIDAEAESMFQPGPAWVGLSAEAAIDLALNLLVQHFQKHAKILGVFILMTAGDPRLRSGTSKRAQRIIAGFRDRLMEHAARFPHPNPASAIEAIFSLAFESLGHHVTFSGEFWQQGPHPMAETAHLLPRLARLHLLTPPDRDA